MAVSLTSFLQKSRRKATSYSGDTKTTIVIGNPSCDLDSFVSAVLVAYCLSLKSLKERPSYDPTHIPVLNLPTIPASELWRFRPEFRTALRLATKRNEEDQTGENDQDATKDPLASLTTLADISAPAELDTLAYRFTGEQETPLRTFLVDHNSPSISTLLSDELDEQLDVVGCIDHHIDEHSVPVEASPRIIQTGIGSCTSLVVQYLRDANLWPTMKSPDDQQNHIVELAKLALAPILIDTFNLKATGDKCSDLDRDTVAFLETQILPSSSQSASTTSRSSLTTTASAPPDLFDREAFFNQINDTKQSALDFLTLPEILSHDYKSFLEVPSGEGTFIGIGTSSLVRPLRWLITEKSDSSPSEFVHSLLAYMSSQDLTILALLTRSSKPSTTLTNSNAHHGVADGESNSAPTVRKELLLLYFPDRDGDASDIPAHENILPTFTFTMSKTLGLRSWREDISLLNELDRQVIDEGHGDYRIWWQGDTEKSRKQIAPGIREAVRRSRGTYVCEEDTPWC